MTEQKKETRGRKSLGSQPLSKTEKNQRYTEKLRAEGIKPVRLFPSVKLRAALEQRIAERGGSITGNIIEILEDHFHLPHDADENTTS